MINTAILVAGKHDLVVDKITVISHVKNLSRNPFIFGLTAGIIVILLNILVATVAEGSLQKGISILLSNGVFTYLVPLAVAVQMGLFRYYLDLTTTARARRLEKVGVSGSVLSSMTLVSCCVCCIYPVSGMLPAIGLLMAASSFLAQYKEMLVLIGLLVNLAGSAILVAAILRLKKRALTLYNFV